MIEDPKKLKIPKEIADKFNIEANHSTSGKEEVLSSREIWERNVRNGLIEYDDKDIKYEDIVAALKRNPLEDNEYLKQVNQRQERIVKKPTIIVIVVQSSLDDSADYDEEDNQLVIRAKNEKSALEQIEEARNKEWIKNDNRSASEILAKQAIDPFYKKAPDDKVWWLNNIGIIGEHVFSFDKIKTYNLFAKYPHSLTPEEKEIFDRENPFWADFFSDRQ